MRGEETSNRESILGAILLVISHSKIRDVVSRDALKAVLEGQYPDLVEGGTLHLQVVWNLLAAQESFDSENAKAPFSLLKTWATDLRIPVTLPKELSGLSATELVMQSSQCKVPKGQKTRTLNPEASKSMLITLEEQEPRGNTGLHEVPSTRRPALEAVLALVGFAGLAFGGYTLAGVWADPPYEKVSLQEFQQTLPVAEAKKLGEEVTVLISSDNWYQRQESERKSAMTAALDKLETSGVTSLIVQDKDKKIRASAQLVGTPAKIVVRLY